LKTLSSNNTGNSGREDTQAESNSNNEVNSSSLGVLGGFATSAALIVAAVLAAGTVIAAPVV